MSTTRSARGNAMIKTLRPIAASLGTTRRNRRYLGFFTGLALLCFLCFLGQRAFRGSRSDGERARAAEARAALLAGRFDAADSLLGRWIAAQPTAAEAHYLRA